MLDRWSIMVFERGISLRRGMSISHSPDAILSQFEDNAMWHLQVSPSSSFLLKSRQSTRPMMRHLRYVPKPSSFLSFRYTQSIIDTDDFQVVIASVRILCETVNEFLNRVTETNRDDEQLLIKCDILR